MIFSASRATLSLGLFMVVMGLVVVPNDIVFGQDKSANRAQAGSPPPCMVFEQMPLTDMHIVGLLAAADEINNVRENELGGFYNPPPETTAKLDAVARKNGLASYNEYQAIRANVLLVISGYDDVTNKYVGREALISLRVSRVRSDRKMSPGEKKSEIASLNAQRGCTLPQVAYRGNIALFDRYRKRLRASSFLH